MQYHIAVYRKPTHYLPMQNANPAVVHVIGASGRSGVALCHALAAAGINAQPVVRSALRWVHTGLPGLPLIADLNDQTTLVRALTGATQIVSCAHARHAPAIIQAAPPGATLILLGSTRKFTRWPDSHGNGVLVGEAAFLRSGRAGVMLHPTMIYGAQGENNVQRLAALLRRLPVVPLPAAGRALVQPIHQADVTAAILASLKKPWPSPQTLVICGPAPVSYANFVAAIGRAAKLSPRPIANLPESLLRASARIARLLPGLPHISPDEIRRLTEDKAFDVEPMIATLGIKPRSLDEGLSTIDF